jgi:dimethylsulfoniopropionate demethylase
MKFFGFDYFEFNEAKHLIARSGWSKQSGYEIYVENKESGIALYDRLFELGKEFNVKSGCPNLIERIESGLLSYGNDIDNNDNPLECGLDKYVNLDSNIDFLGKEKLKEINKLGINKKLRGVKIETKEIDVSKSIKLFDEKNHEIGELRSGVYSPHFEKVVGIAMIFKPYWNISQSFKIKINRESFDGKVCDLPFI